MYHYSTEKTRHYTDCCSVMLFKYPLEKSNQNLVEQDLKQNPATVCSVNLNSLTWHALNILGALGSNILCFRLFVTTILRGKCTPNWNWACFVRYHKIINIFLKSNMLILKKIVWEAQKWHLNFSRPNGSWVIDQNMQNIILINCF